MVKLQKIGAAGAALLVSGGAFAQTAPATFATPEAALTSLAGTATAFGPIMFGMAVIATGIMLGVAWIKKGRSAGR